MPFCLILLTKVYECKKEREALHVISKSTSETFVHMVGTRRLFEATFGQLRLSVCIHRQLASTGPLHAILFWLTIQFAFLLNQGANLFAWWTVLSVKFTSAAGINATATCSEVILCLTWSSVHQAPNVCRAACIYKNQSNCDKFSKLITNCSKEANPEKSRKISKRSRDENIRLIPSRKIPGSRDFAKIPSRKSRD